MLAAQEPNGGELIRTNQMGRSLSKPAKWGRSLSEPAKLGGAYQNQTNGGELFRTSQMGEELIRTSQMGEERIRTREEKGINKHCFQEQVYLQLTLFSFIRQKTGFRCGSPLSTSDISIYRNIIYLWMERCFRLRIESRTDQLILAAFPFFINWDNQQFYHKLCFIVLPYWCLYRHAILALSAALLYSNSK
ncbi:hypothetical protein XENTR_v10007115 [Xenopus tropicalis]|nr:hypothetical protein XENTR_v10007115 [Xenopus tropicalis]